MKESPSPLPSDGNLWGREETIMRAAPSFTPTWNYLVHSCQEFHVGPMWGEPESPPLHFPQRCPLHSTDNQGASSTSVWVFLTKKLRAAEVPWTLGKILVKSRGNCRKVAFQTKEGECDLKTETGNLKLRLPAKPRACRAAARKRVLAAPGIRWALPTLSQGETKAPPPHFLTLTHNSSSFKRFVN